MTINGKTELVIQDAVTYQELLEWLENAELIASLRVALTKVDDGKGIPFTQLESELAARYSV